MDKVINYIYTALMVLAIIANVLSLILTSTLKKNGVKVPAKLENLMKLFKEIIPNAVMSAEESGAKGAAKKTIAQSNIMLECSKLGIDYATNAVEIDKAIEELISLSKNVNRVNIINDVKE